MKNTVTLGLALGASLLMPSAMAANSSGNGYGVSTSATVSDYGLFVSVTSAYRMAADASGNYTNSTDTPPVQLNGCPGVVQNNPNVLCLGSPGGTADTIYNLGASTSSAGLQTARNDDLANTYGVAAAAAYANLSTGQLGASARGDYFRGGQAVAIFNDVLSFSVTGAAASTVTPIGVVFSIDGQLSNATNALSGASVQGALGFGSAFATVFYQRANGDTTSPPFGALNQGGWLSGSWAPGSNPGQSTFTGVYALTGASEVLGVRSALTASASSVAASNYFNTSSIQFNLPSNVSFTSESALFLTAVPEPGTWALMLWGLGALGLIARRRARAY